VAALAIGYWSCRPSLARDWYLCAALGLILAGTLGNLYDRLVFGGVRDFLYFKLIEWPVFNLADCFLVCGAGLLLTQAIWNRSPAAAPDRTQAALSTAAAEAK
jgi:lipoprotein signal peptidase